MQERLSISESELTRIVIGVDPAVTSEVGSDSTGIVVAGLGVDGHGYVLADRTCKMTPDNWARRIVGIYHEFNADTVVVEVNNGGDLVSSVLRAVEPNLPIRSVHASHGKITRAQPISALYERGLIHHVGNFPELEDEMCSWIVGMKSPDKLDSLVWALWELMITAGTLGWIEYLKSGQGQVDLKNTENSMQKVQSATDLAKPVIADEAPKCPECGSALVRDIPGGMKRCQQCGVQYYPKDAKGNLIKPKVSFGASRKDM